MLSHIYIYASFGLERCELGDIKSNCKGRREKEIPSLDETTGVSKKTNGEPSTSGFSLWAVILLEMKMLRCCCFSLRFAVFTLFVARILRRTQFLLLLLLILFLSLLLFLAA